MISLIISLFIMCAPFSCLASQPTVSQPTHIQLEGQAEKLDLQDMDILSQETFGYVINEHQKEHIPFILAQFCTTNDKGKKEFFYYEANGFTRAVFGIFYLAPLKHRSNQNQQATTFKNPLTNKPLTAQDEIHYFRIHGIEGPSYYLGTDFDLHAHPHKKPIMQNAFLHGMSDLERETLFDGLLEDLKNSQAKRFHSSVPPERAEEFRAQLIEQSLNGILKILEIMQQRQMNQALHTKQEILLAIIHLNNRFNCFEEAIVNINNVIKRIENPNTPSEEIINARTLLLDLYFEHATLAKKLNPNLILRHANACLEKESSYNHATQARAHFLRGYMNNYFLNSPAISRTNTALDFIKASELDRSINHCCAVCIGDMLVNQSHTPKTIASALSYFEYTINTPNFNNQHLLELAHTGLTRIYNKQEHLNYQLAKKYALAVINNPHSLPINKIHATLSLSKVCIEDNTQSEPLILCAKIMLDDIIHTAHNPAVMAQFQMPIELELELIACRGHLILQYSNQAQQALKDFNTVISNPKSSAQAKARAYLGKALISDAKRGVNAFENYTLAINVNSNDAHVVNTARLGLAMLQLDGSIEIPKNTKNAHDLFKQIAQDEHAPRALKAQASFALGSLYYDGAPMVERDFVQAKTNFAECLINPLSSQSIKNKSNLLIGKIYLVGSHGVTINPFESQPHFLDVIHSLHEDKASRVRATLGLAHAYYQLNQLNSSSRHVTSILENNDTSAKIKAKALVLAGSIATMSNNKNYQKAHDNFHAALAIHDATPDTKNKAHHGLCNLYLEGGHGINKDIKIALAHLKQVNYAIKTK